MSNRTPFMKLAGRDVYAASLFPHPGDDHLLLCLCRPKDEWVIWNFNRQTGGFFEGKYLGRVEFNIALMRFHEKLNDLLVRSYADRVRKAEKGLKFFDANGEERVVKSKCKKNEGIWYCTTCREALPNGFSKDSHIASPGEHVMAWLCKEHGLEEP